jgi:hypothetical protein
LDDALASAAQVRDLSGSLDLVAEARYGTTRRMIVKSLWRVRKSPLVEPALVALITDPAVALHAISALRRSIGPAAALPYLWQVAADQPGDQLARSRAVRSVELRPRLPGSNLLPAHEITTGHAAAGVSATEPDVLHARATVSRPDRRCPRIGNRADPAALG